MSTSARPTALGNWPFGWCEGCGKLTLYRCRCCGKCAEDFNDRTGRGRRRLARRRKRNGVNG